MGILDNLKNVLGGKKPADANASTTSPSQVLRENGLDRMSVETAAPEPEPDAGHAPATAAKTADNDEITYTVKPGDTLWKIAVEHYGEGSKYLKIFAANTPMLKDPDHIFPGQELVIPAEND